MYKHSACFYCLLNCQKVGSVEIVRFRYIDAQGDELFKSVRINKSLAGDELPFTFSFRVMISLAKKSHLFVDIDNLFKNYRHHICDQTGNGAMFTCGGFSLAAIWCVNSFFLFDSNSRNIDGFNDPNGQTVILEFCTMISLKNFIKSVFENCTSVSLGHSMTYNTLVCRFQIT